MGRSVSFGISLVPYAAAYPDLVRQVQVAETSGAFELVGIQDHPYQRRFLDTYALIADLLARTQRLRFFPDVTSLPMRGPTMIAKAAASLDVMSGGRFELGLGAGNFWDAVEGMGGPRRTNPEAVDALEEAIPIIRAALDVGPERRVVRGDGPHFRVAYPAGPPPAHRVSIWLGVYRPRGLRLAGRVGDGWIPSVGYTNVPALRRASAVIDQAAVDAGRQPSDVLRIWNVGGLVTDEAAGDGALVGPVAQWVDTLAEWATDPGVEAFIFWPAEDEVAQIERFAAEVAPAVREALEGMR
jgi:alkanesulfonate monooxygenase SsuD/methylene tetrahydromethanopterin reductase-like flavin-dependent oxidoreductase (luciferase family)